MVLAHGSGSPRPAQGVRPCGCRTCVQGSKGASAYQYARYAEGHLRADNKNASWAWLLTPIILAMREAENKGNHSLRPAHENSLEDLPGLKKK
jgi:hypothetical protein